MFDPYVGVGPEKGSNTETDLMTRKESTDVVWRTLDNKFYSGRVYSRCTINYNNRGSGMIGLRTGRSETRCSKKDTVRFESL